jgi:nucleotide-binding universal stress UspA family protein
MDAMEDFKNILVVTNSTKYCRQALHYGISLAKRYNAEVHVLHLMHDPFNLDHWQLALPSLKSIKKEYQDMRTTTRKDLDAMIAAEQAKGLSIQVGIAEGPPEKEILHLVRDKKIDLLIMLAHEEGYLEQSLFGSLNEKIHRKLPCTVMFIKQEPLPVKNQAYCLRADRVQPCEAS